ncbi:hypothetical protein [Aequorivita viscosa]|uniref:PEP-CTERM protein-sorting domain-containing protein n=1 Tax=Aequorivita viscosa TaxID=797419 RepID=A0A1M6K8B0_9FLAO|nr:hypothetical protein [Aequorivita viscosa]SDW60901.1 hypothetical protein SAMN05216556_107136 [Aequorivita viscosa]SHJ55175.1 hypothetical protein SAMN04487908_11959 [Aequorivita viscosa]
MKNNKIFTTKIKVFFTGLLLLGSLTASAQIGLPGGDPNIPDAPIDGFLTVGLIAGACLGLRKQFKGLKE